MKTTNLLRVSLIVCGIALIGLPAAEGYDRWSVNDDATNCGFCHGDFRNSNYVSPVDGQNWGNLHNIHRENMLNDDCATCHYGAGGDEFPVLLNLSGGGNGLAPISCVGCHGVDPQDPLHPNGWGAGIRAHHLNAGVGPDNNGKTCASAGCHVSDPVPQPEDTLPEYYLNPGNDHPNMPTDSCNPASAGYPESFAGADIGIDNDGDLIYDEADPDCGGPTPTPTPTPTSTPTHTPTSTPPPPTPTFTPTSTPVPPTPTPTPPPADLIFSDGFESGDTSMWSSGARTFFAGLDQARRLARKPFMKSTAFLVMFAGVALVSLPGIQRRRRRRKDNR